MRTAGSGSESATKIIKQINNLMLKKKESEKQQIED